MLLTAVVASLWLCRFNLVHRNKKASFPGRFLLGGSVITHKVSLPIEYHAA